MPSKAARSPGDSAIAARLERPLAEVVDLPEQEVLVERARSDDAGRAELRQRLLRLGEVAHRADVELLLARRVGREEGGEGVVAEVFEQHPAARGVLAVRPAARRPRATPGGRAPRGTASGPAAAPVLPISSGFAPVGHEHADERCRAAGAGAEVPPRARLLRASAPRPMRAATAAGNACATSASSAAKSSSGRPGSEIGWGRSGSKRTWRWGSRRPGPRGTTAGRWPPSSDPSSRRPRRPSGAPLAGPARARPSSSWLERLEEWNARIDLTAARSREELVDLMLADALVLARRMPRGRPRGRRRHRRRRSGARPRAPARPIFA